MGYTETKKDNTVGGRSKRLASKGALISTELVAVIGILVWLLFSILSRGKNKAQQTVCRDRLGQIDLTFYHHNGADLPATNWPG
jgi:hypothetical protein